MDHPTTEALAAGLDAVRASPADAGTLRLIVRRPAVDERELLDRGELSRADGLVGDTWRSRVSRHAPDDPADADRQLTIMNARAIALIARDDSPGRWAEAGDQLYVDIDLSEENLPPGTRLKLGDAVIEITAKPHTGCAKFAARFGLDAARFVNSPEGIKLRLRGVNAIIVEPGAICTGDVARKL